MLTYRLQKVKSFISASKNDLYIAAIIFFVGMASFGLGRLSAIWPVKEPVTITTNQESGIKNYGANDTGVIDTSANSQNSIFNIQNTSKGKYVASKSGTAYHFPWCAGALKIKEENKIWFQTKDEAQKAGYKPAGNCEGL